MWSQDDRVIESMEKLVNIWNAFSLQQIVMCLKPLNPGLAILTCVPLDYMFTRDIYLAILPGIGETNQENVQLYVLPRDDKEFVHRRWYHHSQRCQETSQVNQMTFKMRSLVNCTSMVTRSWTSGHRPVETG
jgi:hypothetical protein